MAATVSRIGVVGLGKVGELAARLLVRAGFDVVGLDRVAPDGLDIPVAAVDAGDAATLQAHLGQVDAVLSCLPYNLNATVADAAAAAGVHYFDLTEDVETTRHVRMLAASATSAFVPQCGLAPGLIGIVGAALAERFDELRSVELKVGALPRNPSGLLGYAFNWSPEGVVNEYLNDCEVIREGRPQTVPPMGEVETVWIGGTQLEAFTTSGGLGTMCETYAGRVERLDYKTLRYPGHCSLMRFFFDELRMGHSRELAGEILVNAKPPVDDDIVYLYAAVEGLRRGALLREQHVRAWEPAHVDGRAWRAISWTTAASACAVIELVAAGLLPTRGFVRQEEVPLAALLGTVSGSLFAAGEAVSA